MQEIPSGPRADAALKRMMDTLYGNGREGLTVTVGVLKDDVAQIKGQIREARDDIKAIREQGTIERVPMGPAKKSAIVIGISGSGALFLKFLYECWLAIEKLTH